ncbi:MAG: ABC transporter ATP-binding protein, partial [Chloroflexi bacterium]|nr:ABC transporter ATP-binding protein [Chloroflexota bacterium]
MPAIQLQDVSVSYRILSVADYNLKRRFLAATRRIRDQHVVIEALRGISLDVTSGTRLGLVGPNGA